MLEPDTKQKGMAFQRRNPRPHNLIPDLDVPPVITRWFHAIDNPIVDPASIRRAKSSSNLNKSSTASQPHSTTTTGGNTNNAIKSKLSSKWVPFSQRDSMALEKAFQNYDVRARVPVNEDHLFEVDVTQRTISPVYWEGPTYEVRRATWFIQSDGWVPCEENMAEQIELGYYKHKPYLTTPQQTNEEVAVEEEKKLEISLSKQSVDKQWNLLGPYLGQYIVYTGEDTAWLLSNSTSSKFAKSIITRLTNKQNLGGTRLVRGYPAVEELTKKSKKASAAVPPAPVEEEEKLESTEVEEEEEVQQQQQQEQIEAEDYDNENSEEEVRKIDHLMFVIHGVGQKMSERTGHSFVHDVNTMRKTLKLAYPAVMAPTTRSNGIQVLPVMWRQDIKFGMAADEGEGIEADLGMLSVDDGCPTLDELTLEGVPNIRTVVSDVLLDVPLYMTPRYREQMTRFITKEINRIYQLFCARNPDFAKSGKVSIFGHSLGSLLAFDMLTLQPMTPPEQKEIVTTQKLPPLLFPVQHFFAAGSPLGVILLLRGFKIGSRKLLNQADAQAALSEVITPSSSSINLCYPAVENLYNIFHKSDPVAYRLEPLIARHYSAKLKPEPIPYMKGGLKSVIDASFNMGSGIANRAGAMYESFKMGLTTNLLMRGLGLSRQQIYQDTHPQEMMDDSLYDKTSDVDLETETPTEHRLSRVRSNSDPAHALLSKENVRRSPPFSAMPYLQGAKRLKMLNATGRVDYCIQEGLLENPYLSAFSAHMQYWQDLDVAAFIIKQIYGTKS